MGLQTEVSCPATNTLRYVGSAHKGMVRPLMVTFSQRFAPLAYTNFFAMIVGIIRSYV